MLQQDQANLDRIRDLQDLNTSLRKNLSQNAQDFKDLLSQLDLLRKDVKGKDARIAELESEVRLRPSIAQMNSLKVQLEQLGS
mmetsp:Transcript_22505/g.30126  ORF Transcript_22505/g.30126 Transcript_22505/m.30126 type:complete len:83 (+) Transcript_22505:1675-1923(+)